MVLEAPAACFRCALLARSARLPNQLTTCPGAGKARTPLASGAGFRAPADSGAQQTADLLSLTQHRVGDCRRALGAAAQYGVDVSGVGHQSAHLATDSPQYLDGELG